MMPAATGAMNEWWRNSSRLWTFEMWHSTPGRLVGFGVQGYLMGLRALHHLSNAAA